jgi:hypothetical protein
VTFTIQRAASGRLVKGHCKPVTRANRKRRRCTHMIAVPGTLTRTSPAGANSFTFTGRIGGHTLGPGSYTLTATATTAGRTGTRHTIPFQLAR